MQRRAASTTGFLFIYFAAAVSLRINAAVYVSVESSRENYENECGVGQLKSRDKSQELTKYLECMLRRGGCGT